MEIKEFTRRTWIVCAIAALFVAALLLFQATFNVVLLVLAGILVAVYFRGLSGLIRRKTGWKQGLSVVISVVTSLLIITALFWLLGAKIQTQVQQLSDTLPKSLNAAKEHLNNSDLGSRALKKLTSSETQERMQLLAQSFFKSTFGILGDIYVVLFLGIFFTAAPALYVDGIVALVPKAGQPKAEQVLAKVGSNLRKWLKGKLFAMLIVAVLTAIGLVIIGIPMWLALAVLAGLLNFIPNFGPLIALIPAVLVASINGPATAAWVAALYILVQVVESNAITPAVQKKLVNIPPAMIIIAQLFIAPLSGGWGLIVATPLLLIIMTIVQEVYIKAKHDSTP